MPNIQVAVMDDTFFFAPPVRLVLLFCKVICAVYGPHAQTGRDSSFSEEGQLKCDFSYAPFATPGGRRDSRGGKKDDERELSTLLRQTLESSVQVGTSLIVTSV